MYTKLLPVVYSSVHKTTTSSVHCTAVYILLQVVYVKLLPRVHYGRLSEVKIQYVKGAHYGERQLGANINVFFIVINCFLNNFYVDCNKCFSLKLKRKEAVISEIMSEICFL